MSAFDEQVARLEKGEVDETDQVTPAGENAQVEGAAVIPEPETAEPPLEGAEAEASAVEGDSATEPTGDEEPPAKGVQKRIDQLTRQKYEAKREAEYWRKAALGEAQPGPTPIQPIQQAPAPVYQVPRPRIEDFANDPDPYAALAYAAGEWAAAKRDYENQTRAYQAQQFQQMNAQQQTIISKMEAGVAKYPDFVEVTDDLGRIITPAMREALFDSDKFPDLAYHLAQQPDEVRRIAKLTPLAQVRELGKLEDKLAVKTANPAAKEVRTPTKVESAGSGLPKATPNVQKMFAEAQKGGGLRDWVKYIEATER